MSGVEIGQISSLVMGVVQLGRRNYVEGLWYVGGFGEERKSGA